MYKTGGDSWRIDERESDTLSTLLYVRAVAGFDPVTQQVPPLLDASDINTVSVGVTGATADAWSALWSYATAEPHLDDPELNPATWLTQATQDPALRDLIDQHAEPAAAWLAQRHRDRQSGWKTDPTLRQQAAQRRRMPAEIVAGLDQQPPPQLFAEIITLPVRGTWSQLIRHDRLLISDDTRNDPTEFTQILKQLVDNYDPGNDGPV